MPHTRPSKSENFMTVLLGSLLGAGRNSLPRLPPLILRVLCLFSLPALLLFPLKFLPCPTLVLQQPTGSSLRLGDCPSFHCLLYASLLFPELYLQKEHKGLQTYMGLPGSSQQKQFKGG